MLRNPLLALGAFALAACADPVAPRPTGANVPNGGNFAVVQNSTSPVQFLLPAGPLCGLTTDVTGTGEFHAVIRVSQSKSGVWKVEMSLSAPWNGERRGRVAVSVQLRQLPGVGRPRRSEHAPARDRYRRSLQPHWTGENAESQGVPPRQIQPPRPSSPSTIRSSVARTSSAIPSERRWPRRTTTASRPHLPPT